MSGTPPRRVCVIGAGIAGLATVKVLRADGFDAVAFEREAAIGGVWAPTRTYPGLRTNNGRESYAFSNHPYPPTADDFPTAEQVRAYLESYVDRFGLRPSLHVGTEVVHVARTGSGSAFQVRVRPSGHEAGERVLDFDFVVVCNGVFSRPSVPSVEGSDGFTGVIRHSSAVDRDVVADRDVVVVGGGKSALDCAAWAGRHARSCTLVCREPHWMVPRWFFGFVRADRIVLSRLGELLLPYHRGNRLEAFLHGQGRRFVAWWWRGMSRMLRRQLAMPASMTPRAPLPAGFENVGVGGDVYRLVAASRVVPRRASLARFAGGRTVDLDTGERLDADVVVFATGWRQGVPFLSDELRHLVERAGGFRLYRHVLCPDEPRLGFVGYASSTACQLTSELAAHWLSQAFLGNLSLPGVRDMDQEIDRVRRWAAECWPGRQGFFIGPHVGHYADELLRDMGLPIRRTRNVFVEYFTPLWPARYRAVDQERRRSLPRAALLRRGQLREEPIGGAVGHPAS